MEKYVASHNPEVIYIQESWLNKNHQYELPGYFIHRKDFINKEDGGVATFMKNGVQHWRININSTLEAVAT